MTQLLPNGKQQFVDINGRPLVGGKVYFYSVGTNTPKDTFQDVGLTILNTNPVVLNARGQASIYGAGNYRQVLRDIFGSLIWDQVIPDSTVGINDQLIADLANPTDPEKGAAMIGFSGGDLREYIADATDLGLTTLNDIIKYAALHNVPVQGRGTYSIVNETIDLAGKSISLRLEEATVVRNIEGTLILSAPVRLSMKFGAINDSIALLSRMISVFGGTNLDMSYRSGISDGTPLYASSVEGVSITGIKNYRAFTSPVSSADQGRPYELKSCSRVYTNDVHWGPCGTGPKIEAISTGISDDIRISNMSSSYTYDTALFLRLVATAGAFKRLVLSNVTIDRAGKAGVKFSADSADGVLLRQAILTNVIVTGYAQNVSSPGISSFKDASASGVKIEQVTMSNCIVDGVGSDGSVGSTTGDCSGISFRYLDYAVFNGVQCRNTLNQGIHLQSVNRISGSGNVVSNAGVSAAGNEINGSGISLISVIGGSIQVDAYDCASHGFYLDKTKFTRLSGCVDGNSGYGIKTVIAGLAAAQTTGNTYSLTFTNNTLGYGLFAERLNEGISSQLYGCVDALGSMIKGTTARRDAISAQWQAGMFIGYQFYNTTTATQQVWTGSAWVNV